MAGHLDRTSEATPVTEELSVKQNMVWYSRLQIRAHYSSEQMFRASHD